jgi:hypothetical protein
VDRWSDSCGPSAVSWRRGRVFSDCGQGVQVWMCKCRQAAGLRALISLLLSQDPQFAQTCAAAGSLNWRKLKPFIKWPRWKPASRFKAKKFCAQPGLSATGPLPRRKTIASTESTAREDRADLGPHGGSARALLLVLWVKSPRRKAKLWEQPSRPPKRSLETARARRVAGTAPEQNRAACTARSVTGQR